jgi:hypothetical protein
VENVLLVSHPLHKTDRPSQKHMAKALVYPLPIMTLTPDLRDPRGEEMDDPDHGTAILSQKTRDMRHMKQ